MGLPKKKIEEKERNQILSHIVWDSGSILPSSPTSNMYLCRFQLGEPISLLASLSWVFLLHVATESFLDTESAVQTLKSVTFS